MVPHRRPARCPGSANGEEPAHISAELLSWGWPVAGTEPPAAPRPWAVRRARRESRWCYQAESPGSHGYLPWQTCRMTEGPDGSLAAAIAEELTACRQRGIERLDVGSHNQSPVQTPVLQRLAREYVTISQVRAHDRISQLKYLFRDAIEAFAAENEADAQLAGDLFFGDSQNRVTKSAGELLDIARKKSEYRTEALFRQARHDAFANFARYILGFVEDVKRGNTESSTVTGTAGNVSVLPQLGANSSNSVPLPEVQRQDATTGYVDQGQHFVHLLAEAANATIVGFTNESLAPLLRMALDRKRAASQKPDACWDFIRIVFLSDKLLDLVNDDRREYPDPEEVLKQRRRAAVHGRRTVNVFLRSLPAARWTTYESPYFHRSLDRCSNSRAGSASSSCSSGGRNGAPPATYTCNSRTHKVSIFRLLSTRSSRAALMTTRSFRSASRLLDGSGLPVPGIASTCLRMARRRLAGYRWCSSSPGGCATVGRSRCCNCVPR